MNNVSSQGWLRTTEGAGSALPGSVPRAQGPAPADKLPLTHQQNAGLLHKEPLYQAESTTWWFFFFITFCCFFFLSSWQLHVQPEARAGCAARSRHRGSRPEHPTARKSCEKGKKKGTSLAEVAEVGSELRTVRPPAAAEHLRALSSCTSCPYKGNCGGCSPRSHCQPVPRGKKQPWDRDGKVPARAVLAGKAPNLQGKESVAENEAEKLLWGSVTHLHHQNLRPCATTLLLLWFGGLWGWAGVTLPPRNPAKTLEEAHEEGGRAV